MLPPPLQWLAACQTAQMSLLCAPPAHPPEHHLWLGLRGTSEVLWKPSSNALILQSQAHGATGKTPSCPDQSGCHHCHPMGARRGPLHGSSSPKQEVMIVSDLQTFVLMREICGRFQTWLINKLLHEQISMRCITNLQIIWIIRMVETCDVRKDEA